MKSIITGSVMAVLLMTANPAAAEVGGTITRQAPTPTTIDSIVMQVLGLFTWESAIGTVTFDDYKYTATAGCNNIFSSYTLAGQTIDFGQPASTMMYCDGKMENEAALSTILDTATTMAFQDGKLVLIADTSTIGFTPTFTASSGK